MTMETPEKKELIKHFIRHGISLAEKDQLSLAGEEGRPIKPSLEKQKELLDFTSETSEYIYLLLKDIKDKWDTIKEINRKIWTKERDYKIKFYNPRKYPEPIVDERNSIDIMKETIKEIKNDLFNLKYNIMEHLWMIQDIS